MSESNIDECFICFITDNNVFKTALYLKDEGKPILIFDTYSGVILRFNFNDYFAVMNDIERHEMDVLKSNSQKKKYMIDWALHNFVLTKKQYDNLCEQIALEML
jgi:hypothetical protein